MLDLFCSFLPTTFNLSLLFPSIFFHSSFISVLLSSSCALLHLPYSLTPPSTFPLSHPTLPLFSIPFSPLTLPLLYRHLLLLFSSHVRFFLCVSLFFHPPFTSTSSSPISLYNISESVYHVFIECHCVLSLSFSEGLFILGTMCSVQTMDKCFVEFL